MSATQRGVTADPKRAAIERELKRVKDERAKWYEQKAAAIQAAADARKCRLQRAAEVETCYRQHVPRQVFHADEMQEGGRGPVFNQFELDFDNGEIVWGEDDVLVDLRQM